VACGFGAVTASETLMKINSTDKTLLRAVERGEWIRSGISHRERSRYEGHARATLRKYHRLTVNLSKRDLEALRERAATADVSCEALVTTVLHKYVTGHLREDFKEGSPRSRQSVPEPSKVTAREKAAVAGTELIVPRLLNMRQAAKYLGCSFWTVRDYVLQGLIPVVELPPLRARTGARQRETLRRVVIDRADLDKFVETRKS
jgi:predicted DNA binding CopG/RHH family protein